MTQLKVDHFYRLQVQANFDVAKIDFFHLNLLLLAASLHLVLRSAVLL